MIGRIRQNIIHYVCRQRNGELRECETRLLIVFDKFIVLVAAPDRHDVMRGRRVIVDKMIVSTITVAMASYND